MHLQDVLYSSAVTGLSWSSPPFQLLQKVSWTSASSFAAHYRYLLSGSVVGAACAVFAFAMHTRLRAATRTQQLQNQKRQKEVNATKLGCMLTACTKMKDLAHTLQDIEQLTQTNKDALQNICSCNPEIPLDFRLIANLNRQLHTLITDKHYAYSQALLDTKNLVQCALATLRQEVNAVCTDKSAPAARKKRARELIVYIDERISLKELDAAELNARINEIHRRLEQEMAIPTYINRYFRIPRTKQSVDQVQTQHKLVRHGRDEIVRWLSNWKKAVEEKLPAQGWEADSVRATYGTIDRLGATPTPQMLGAAYTELKNAIIEYNKPFWIWETSQLLPAPPEKRLKESIERLKQYVDACEHATQKLQRTQTNLITTLRKRGAFAEELRDLAKYDPSNLTETDPLANNTNMHIRLAESFHGLKSAVEAVTRRLQARSGLGDVLKYTLNQSDLYAAITAARADLLQLGGLEEQLYQRIERGENGRLRPQADNRAQHIIVNLIRHIGDAKNFRYCQITNLDGELATIKRKSLGWVWLPTTAAVTAFTCSANWQFMHTPLPTLARI